MENNFVFMAFAKGTESTEGTGIKRYIGVAPIQVLAVNPNKAELEKLYGTSLENEPEYLSEVENNGKKTKSVRIDFVAKTVAEKCNGIETIMKVPFFIRKEYMVGSQSGKIKVIDKYGRTAWVTKEEFDKKAIPMYTNGPANIDADYRPCYSGEEELTTFIKNYLNIPNVMKYVNKQWVMVDNPDDSEARLDEIDKYFEGNFKELNTIIKLQPSNKVKVMFGVRTTDENKQYQAAYTHMTLKNSVTDYSRLDKDLQERKAAGAFSTTEFKVCDLKEYTVEATDFSKESSSDCPFSEEGTSSSWF